MTTIDPRYPVGKFKRPESYSDASRAAAIQALADLDRKSTRLNSSHT